MNAIPPAVIGMKLNAKLGGVVSVFPTYPMSLTAKSVVWLVNSYRPWPEFEEAQFSDRLYGELWVALTQVSMAGEANDDPVPLMGAGVVFARSAFPEVGRAVGKEDPVPLEDPEVVFAPPVAVVVVVTDDDPAVAAAVVVVVTDEDPVVVVVVL